MAYGLGIDVGTTFTAAAIIRDGRVEVVPLATYQVAVPSVVYAAGDELLFGAPAERRGAAEPQGLAREFKRRVGDSVPLMLSGSPYHADRLTALMAKWVIDSVAEQIGSRPTRIVMSYPANWTEYQLGTLRNALADVGHGTTELISEPAAAALDYAAAANVATGSCVLVYDLGGGTFDVALLRREGESFEHQVEPSGIERLGGIDFDEAVFQFAIATVPQEVLDSVRRQPEGAAGLAQLRRRCVDAKEALSSDHASDIPIMLPNYTTTVRITRPEFEEMIRPSILQTIRLVESTLHRAGIQPTELESVLLVGGSSRIPLVSQMVAEQLELPVRIDAHPKLVTAKGAARQADSKAPSKRSSPPVRDGAKKRAAGEPSPSRRRLTLAAAAVVTVAAAAAIWLAIGRDDQEGSARPAPSTTPATSGPADSVVASSTTPTSTTIGAIPFAPYAVTTEIPTLGGPIDLELVGTDLWVMSEQAGALQRFDTTLRNPPLQVDLGFTAAEGRNGNDIINAGGVLYVTQKDAKTVARVDIDANPPTVVRIDVPGRPLNGTVLDDVVWVTAHADVGSSEPGFLIPIDQETETAGEPVPMPEVPYGIVAVDGEVWVTFDEADKIGRVDVLTGQVEYVEGLDEPIDLLPVGDDLLVTVGGANEVAVIDRTQLLVVRSAQVGFTPFKLVAGMGSVWVSNIGLEGQPGTISRLEPSSRDLRPLQEPIEVLLAPIELAAGPDRVYVANYGSASVSVLAPESASEIGPVTTGTG